MTAFPHAEIEFDVPFHDIDAGLIVWHGHYFKYLEIARTALMRKCHLDVPDIIALGYRMVVIESHIRHAYPLTYGDHVKVSATFKDVDHRLRIGYVVYNQSAQRKAARAASSLATLTAEGTLLLATPNPILERIRASM